MSKPLACHVLGTLALSITSCGPASDTLSAATDDQLLTPDASGWVDASTTGTTGIQGQWHTFADSRFGAPTGNCLTESFGECSNVNQPVEGLPYAPTEGLGMCTSGVIARWISGSDGVTPDGSPGWAGIVLELAMPDWPDPKTTTAPDTEPYDADAHGVTGFAFDIDSEPAPGASPLVHVGSVGPEQSRPRATLAPFERSHALDTPVHAGRNEFKLNDLGAGTLDSTRLLRVGFLVSGNDAHAVTYGFCIDRLTALRGHAGPKPDGQPLEPDETGWVARSTTGTTGIQGTWFAVADGIGEQSSCRVAGHAECSAFSEPDPAAEGYAPRPGLGMCTSGLVARVAAGSDGLTPDWSAIWGAMIGFNFDDNGGVAEPYDAARYGVTGFAFDIDSEPPPGAELRVELSTPDTATAPAYWGGDVADWSPVHAGHNEFKFADVGGPPYLPNPAPLDTRALTQIAFHVQSNETRAVSYAFCIKNLTALRD